MRVKDLKQQQYFVNRDQGSGGNVLDASYYECEEEVYAYKFLIHQILRVVEKQQIMPPSGSRRVSWHSLHREIVGEDGSVNSLTIRVQGDSERES